MFESTVYQQRRAALSKLMNDGIVLFPGNTEASYNYPSNTYIFRQDSNFSYFFGLDHPDFFGIIDIDNNTEYLYGNDFDIDDIIWMGPQPKVAELAKQVGVDKTGTLAELATFLQNAVKKGRKIHFAPTYRAETGLTVARMLGLSPYHVNDYASKNLIDAIVKLRSVKSELEVAEIEKAVDVAWEMFTTGMRMAYPGRKEQEIAGVMEGISLSKGGRPASFPIILSINGQTLHNHYHGNLLKEGRMMVMDAGAEVESLYCSDITRTVPVGGKFSQKQKEIYEIVLQANLNAQAATKPGVFYKDCHKIACETIASGLKELGLMKGDVKEAVEQGAHALFLPHGLGHMLGMDVHDMEGLGQINVGYDHEIQPSTQFGTAYLRMGRRLQPGFCITNEPGIYFIPELIDLWKAEKKHADFIDYAKVEEYRDFGGIRIEDDILVTENGSRVLGKPIPKTVEDVENTMAQRL